MQRVGWGPRATAALLHHPASSGESAELTASAPGAPAVEFYWGLRGCDPGSPNQHGEAWEGSDLPPAKVRSQAGLASVNTKSKACPDTLFNRSFLQKHPPEYRRCSGTGRGSSSARAGTRRGTACRTPAGPGPGPTWAGTTPWSWPGSLQREKSGRGTDARRSRVGTGAGQGCCLQREGGPVAADGPRVSGDSLGSSEKC